jgi:lysophospholipase L1-like esterase
MRFRLPLATSLVCLLLAGLCAAPAHAARPWVEAWAAAPHSSAAETAPPSFADQSVRLVVRLRASGGAVRVRLTNAFGDRPVTFGRVTVGLRGDGAALASGTLRPARFGGSAAVEVPPGGGVSSDPVRLRVRRGQDLSVSVYLPSPTGTVTWHRSALQTNYVSGTGDHTASVDGAPFTTTRGNWFFLESVSVAGTPERGTLVAVGDSITDGSGSASDANHRWPDFLSARLEAAPGADPAVVNEGIAGNKVLTDDARNGQSLLRRLERDVLSRAGLRHVILLEGVNDLRSASPSATPEAIVAAYRQVIAKVRAAGARIHGGTITPLAGSARYTPEMEAKRAAINEWILTGGEFDGVVDFAAAIADPADPTRMLPLYDRGDHLHPNDAGYEAMAAAVDLSLF